MCACILTKMPSVPPATTTSHVTSLSPGAGAVWPSRVVTAGAAGSFVKASDLCRCVCVHMFAHMIARVCVRVCAYVSHIFHCCNFVKDSDCMYACVVRGCVGAGCV